jgi:prepilin-type N-terminal cleavage/methylation domain-containing protein
MHRRAFTLIELLVVITIIGLIASMVIAVVASVKEKGRELSTRSRMSAVLNGLSTYAISEGSPAVALQRMLALNGATVGVPAFDTVKVIVASAAAGAAEPPAFRAWINGTGWTSVDKVLIDTTANPEQRRLYLRLADNVVDVMPDPGEVMAITDYANRWPTQWPEADWFNGGTRFPILRFPWGKPGLRIDGELCDPAVVPGAMTRKFTESMTSAGNATTSVETLANSWATCGSSQAGAHIWTFSSVNSAQSDWVTLSASIRSDNTTVPAADRAENLPLPFDLGYLSPLASLQLLQAAGILQPGAAGQNDYRTNRKLSQQWNDAWGHPLIVSLALFQPERYTRSFDGQNRRDLFLRGALQAYQYNRSFYFAVGAAGFRLNPGISDTWTAGDENANLTAYWQQITSLCGAASWTEKSFVAPPWTGIKVGKQGTLKCMLSAPIEVK